MTAEPSPRPWRVSDGFLDRYSTGHRDIVDAKGEFVAVRVSSADAALIVAAVNEHGMPITELIKCYDALKAERDRLRDIVRQLLPFTEGALDGVSAILGDAEMSKAAGQGGAPSKEVMEAFVADGRRVLRDARAAIGEDRP